MFFSNSSGLAVLQKDTALLVCSWGVTDKYADIDWQEDSFDGSGRKSLVL